MCKSQVQAELACLIEAFGNGRRHKPLEFIHIDVERFYSFALASLLGCCPEVAQKETRKKFGVLFRYLRFFRGKAYENNRPFLQCRAEVKRSSNLAENAAHHVIPHEPLKPAD